MLGHGWVMGMSGITGLIALVAAILLFTRSRSAATGLFLGATAFNLLTPFSASLFGHSTYAYVGIISLGHLCAAVGLLWYALSLPKGATPAPAAASSASPDGNRFLK